MCNSVMQKAVGLVVCLLLLSAGFAHAQGEHARRAAVEIQIILGDLRRLQQEAPAALHVQGLKDRIAGSLSVLEILLRMADSELHRPPNDHYSTVDSLRSNWKTNDLATLRQQLENLATTYRLHFNVPEGSLSAAQVENSAHLHGQLCSACHDNAATTTERPAYNLFTEAASLTTTEFIARMLNGVRGDAYTGIDNPLNDIQIGQLYRYYQQGKLAENRQ